MENDGNSQSEPGPSAPAPEYRTYFDTLPAKNLSKIIKWMDFVWDEDFKSSKLPDAFVGIYKGVPFLSLLFSENSPFRKALPSVFSKMNMSLTSCGTNVNTSEGSITIGPEVFYGEAQRSGLFQKIVEALNGANNGQDLQAARDEDS